MGYIVKPDPDQDMYVEWSRNLGEPVACGNRAEMLRILHGDPGASDRFDTPERRLARADELGSSSRVPGEGWWGHDEFPYGYKGMLARKDLVRAVELLAAGRDDEVLALLAPFDDDEDNTEEAE